MTHQSRMLVIIAVVSIGGISALMYTANRYAKVLENHPDSSVSGAAAGTVSAPARQPTWKRAATARALARVDQFIGVRGRMLAEIDRRGGVVAEPGDFDRLRASALNESGMNLNDYGRVRELIRTWRDGQLDESNVMAAAFEQRKAALVRLDLGKHEELDS
jgi:hypothetical protein